MICRYSQRCGGCDGIGKDIQEELLEKTCEIRSLFKEISSSKIDDCKGQYYPLRYRNKIHLAFGHLKGKTLIGFFEEGSTKITDIDECLLFGDWAKNLISVLREFVSRFKIRPVDRDGVGTIRYAHARCVDNKLQLTLVVTTENFAGREWLYHKLNQYFTEISLYININRRTDHAVFDKTFKFIKGTRFMNFDVAGVRVSLSPSSFLQVNLDVAEKMYKSALDMLEITQNTTVVDLYSGIGVTSVLFAKRAKQVLSIEETPSSVENAKFMAKINNVHNIKHLCGKCEKEIDKLNIEGDVVVFVDPARAGLDKRVIDALIKLSPRKIVYMSCNAETCARDVKMLCGDQSLVVEKISPWNMFPYTKHVETLVVLERK